MRTLRVIPRPAALRDAEAAVDYYSREAGPDLAYRFIDALRITYARIGDSPDIGSPRLGQSLGIAALRTRPVQGFPYVVCYQALDGGIDVWRVLHAQSDIPVHLTESEV